jgi:hypothetical protein
MGTGKSVEYFPHDCNAKDDPKIMLMMAQLGLEAYGIYWVLIEYLRDQPGYSAPMLLLDALSRRYGSSKEKFEAIITKFNLFEYNDEFFTSPSLVRRMEPMEAKRAKARESILKRWGKDTNVLPPYNECNSNVIQSIVKESIVKESKVKKSKVKEKEEVSIEMLIIPSSDFLPIWNKWIEFKNKIKKPYRTQEGMQVQFDHLLDLSSNSPELALSIVNQSIGREWEGLFPLKKSDSTSSQSRIGEDPIQRDIRLTREARERNQLNESMQKNQSNGNC